MINLNMDFDLRKAIIQNVSDNTREELKATIVDAIQGGEEKMLPGLGVLFEVIWKNADANEQQMMLETLEEGLKKPERH
jgi:small acid-soluble spore protein I (minor)